MVNKQVMKGKWTQFLGVIKEKFGKLTDDDLKQIAGKREQLLGKIQERYGYAKDRAEKELARFEQEHQDFHEFCESCRCNKNEMVNEEEEM